MKWYKHCFIPRFPFLFLARELIYQFGEGKESNETEKWNKIYANGRAASAFRKFGKNSLIKLQYYKYIIKNLLTLQRNKLDFFWRVQKFRGGRNEFEWDIGDSPPPNNIQFLAWLPIPNIGSFYLEVGTRPSPFERPSTIYNGLSNPWGGGSNAGFLAEGGGVDCRVFRLWGAKRPKRRQRRHFRKCQRLLKILPN